MKYYAVYIFTAIIIIAIIIKEKMNVNTITTLIKSEAVKNNINPAILLAIAQQESSFKPDSQNLSDPNGGSYGLFGLTLGVIKKFDSNITAEQLKNPIINITYAIELLKSNLPLTPTPTDIFNAWNSGFIHDNGITTPRQSPNINKYLSYYNTWNAQVA